MYRHTHKQAHTNTQTRPQTHTQTHTQAHTQTYTHKHTHTQTPQTPHTIHACTKNHADGHIPPPLSTNKYNIICIKLFICNVSKSKTKLEYILLQT